MGPVRGALLLSDGVSALSWSYDGTSRYWNVPAGVEVARYVPTFQSRMRCWTPRPIASSSAMLAGRYRLCRCLTWVGIRAGPTCRMGLSRVVRRTLLMTRWCAEADPPIANDNVLYQRGRRRARGVAYVLTCRTPLVTASTLKAARHKWPVGPGQARLRREPPLSATTVSSRAAAIACARTPSR